MAHREVKAIRSRDPEIVRSRILDAAQAEFMAAGFAGASTNRILDNFGGSKPTMFRYFPTKRALFASVVDRIARRWTADLHTDLEEFEEPAKWLEKFAKKVLRRVLDEENLFVGRMAIAEGDSFPEVAEIYRAHAVDQVETVLAKKLATWIDNTVAERPDPAKDAICFLDLAVSGIVSRALYAGGEAPEKRGIDQHVRYCIALFLNGRKYKESG